MPLTGGNHKYILRFYNFWSFKNFMWPLDISFSHAAQFSGALSKLLCVSRVHSFLLKGNIPFMWHVQNWQIHRDRMQTSRGQRLGEVWASNCKEVQGFFLGWWKCSGINVCNCHPQLYGYAGKKKKRWIAHLRWVNCVVCAVYLNKSVLNQRVS